MMISSEMFAIAKPGTEKGATCRAKGGDELSLVVCEWM